MRTLQAATFVAFFCLMMIVLGGTIFSVMVEYPNWFANVPTSLEATREFYKVLHPGYFFQTTGPLTLLTGILAVATNWRNAQARNLVLVALGTMIAIEVLTFFYIYPRLGVLFGPDAANQTLDALQQAASQFTIADRIRTGMSVIASVVSIAALNRFFKAHYGRESI